jgi:hypothetical protein
VVQFLWRGVGCGLGRLVRAVESVLKAAKVYAARRNVAAFFIGADIFVGADIEERSLVGAANSAAPLSR